MEFLLGFLASNKCVKIVTSDGFFFFLSLCKRVYEDEEESSGGCG